jgi:metal-responsive CopG/Arc/MetJ family transcriptional regulator
MLSFHAEEALMKTVVKKSLSMDADIAERLDQMAKKLKKSFSSLVTDASAEYLQKLEEDELAEAYKQYYADPENLKQDAEIYADFRKLMVKNWPKE